MNKLLVSLVLLIGTAAAQTAPSTTTPAPAAPAQTTPAPAAPAAPTTPATPAPAAPGQAAPTTPAQPPADPATVVARIGSEVLTLGEFERQYRVFVGRLVNNQGVPFSDDVLPYFAEYRTTILDQVVRQRGILQLAAAAGVKADAAKVDEAVQTTRADFGSAEEFGTALKGAGFADEAQFRTVVQESQISSDYLGKLRERFKFSDTVVSGYYKSRAAEYRREAQACVKHILVKDDAAAQGVQTRLKAGEEFGKVAAAVSLDPGSKDKGGDLGCFNQGVTVPEFDRASFSGPLNQLQQIKTEFGTHLLIVSKRTAAGVAPLAEVSTEIRRTLADDASQKYLTSQLARIKTEKFADRVAAKAPTPAPAAK